MPTRSKQSKLGTLYLVPNTLGDMDRAHQLPMVMPIENLKQIAQLKNWIVENSKTTRAFLNAVHTIEPLQHSLQSISMAEWRGTQSKNQSKLKPQDLLAPLLQGESMGLISEAGVPGVADPGAEIIYCAHQMGACVKPLVGPSSILLGLMASGLSGQQFRFLGYLPIDLAKRSKKLKELEQSSKISGETQIWIETPYRNITMLQSCLEHLSGQTQLCLAIDLSLPSEWIWTAPIQEWRKRFNDAKVIEDLLKNRPAIFLMQA